MAFIAELSGNPPQVFVLRGPAAAANIIKGGKRKRGKCGPDPLAVQQNFVEACMLQKRLLDWRVLRY